MDFKYLNIDIHVVFTLQDMKKFETELKNLQVALEQAQTTLTSPEVGRLSLKEQLSHRQVSKNNSGGTTADLLIDSLKRKVMKDNF